MAIMSGAKVDAVYEKGTLRIINPERIDSDTITVRIINRDEILTEEDMEDIIRAVSERESGKHYEMKDVFE